MRKLSVSFEQFTPCGRGLMLVIQTMSWTMTRSKLTFNLCTNASISIPPSTHLTSSADHTKLTERYVLLVHLLSVITNVLFVSVITNVSFVLLGSIRPHPSITITPRLLPLIHSRDYRLLYRRDARIEHHRQFSRRVGA